MSDQPMNGISRIVRHKVLARLEKARLFIQWILDWVGRFFFTERLKFSFSGFLFGILVAFLAFRETRSVCFWTLLGVLISFIITVVYDFWKRLQVKLRTKTKMGRLLGSIHNPGEKCIIFVTEYWRDTTDTSTSVLYNYDGTTPVKGCSRLMGTGDASALPYIYGLLMRAGKFYEDISVVKSYVEFGQEFSENFITIGGLTNRATETLMKQYRSKFEYHFSAQGNLIIKDYGKVKKYIKGNNQCDYGMIIRKTQLNRENKVLFIIAGIQDLGTTGAAYYLLEHASDLADEYGDKDFALIIGVKKSVGEKSAFEVDFDRVAREYLEG